MLELLAPAGNVACAKAAIDNGADAIYLGYSAFSARYSAENFTLEQLAEIVKHAHFCGVKVYVAMNTIVKDEETESFLRTLLSIWALGVDAVILQDVLLGKAVHDAYPDVVLHLSTQAGVCNVDGANFAKECGFSRVITARETPLAELRRIAEVIQTEAFVQGALCTAFSGQCYFSSFAGGNSGNRGRCKQPCRKLYSYDRKGFTTQAYALSLSDLSVGEGIENYIDAGVVSFKIEGRMRRAEYVAAAVRYYRLLLNRVANAKEKMEALSDLKRSYNRGNYTKGLAFGQDKRFLSTAIQGHIGEKVGVVKVINGKFFVESTFKPSANDAFKILRDGKEVGGALFMKTEGRGFILSSKCRLKNGDAVFITTDNAVNARMLSAAKLGQLSLRLRFHENEFAIAQGYGVCVQSEQRLQSAKMQPLKKEDLIACFSKTDGLPIQVSFEEIDLQGNIFIPKSQLNAIRRALYDRINAEMLGKGRVLHTYAALPSYRRKGNNEKTAAIASEFIALQPDIAVYKPNDYAAPLPTSFVNGNFEKFIYYPPFCTFEDCAAIENMLQKHAIDGIYADNYGGVWFAQTHGVKLFAGTGLNITNGVALAELLRLPSTTYYALSKELNEKELSPLIGSRAFVLSLGDIKLMDLCYCPFGKTCATCDKRDAYALTDEHSRVFPVRRYLGANGACRFEVYNCAALVGTTFKEAGCLLDLTIAREKEKLFNAREDMQAQKEIQKNYTSGHRQRGVL